MTVATPQIPGYIAATWKINLIDSDVMFTVRHMLSHVIGHFTRFQGEIVTADDPLRSSVTATVDLASVDTDSEEHNNEIRSKDFFGAAQHPTMSYRSTGIRPEGDGFLVDGELCLHGVTKPVGLHLKIKRFSTDGMGGARAGFSATAEINRLDFGLSFNSAMETGGLVLGDHVQISLDIDATRERSR